jgi:hypothetical protein
MNDYVELPEMRGFDASDLNQLTHVVGKSLAELNVIDPSGSILEPVARAIHSLISDNSSEKQQ